jgi:hypothetical protein
LTTLVAVVCPLLGLESARRQQAVLALIVERIERLSRAN